MGEKSNDRWFDRCKKFPYSVPHSLSRPGSVTCTTHHPVLRSPLWPSFQLRLCQSYVHPRRWEGPIGPTWCVPVLPMGAPGCCSGSVVRCSCSFLPACRAPHRAVSRGLCGWHVGVAVLCLFVGVVRQLGSGFGAGTSRPAWLAAFGITHPCPLAGAGGLVVAVWRACGPLRAPGGGAEERNTGQC